MTDKILLAEDCEEYLEPYTQSLKQSGFVVTSVQDGLEIRKALSKIEFDVILSDSNLPFLDGHTACRRAIMEGKLNPKKTLIIGMSEDSDNQQYWRGLAHLACFYDKGYFPKEKIGEKIRQDLKNFRSGGLWKERMPLLD
jgi:DNA-binding response OmpR family regulator